MIYIIDNKAQLNYSKHGKMVVQKKFKIYYAISESIVFFLNIYIDIRNISHFRLNRRRLNG